MKALIKKHFLEIFADLLKTFDTIDHEILEKKNQKSMEYVVSICHGLKVIFQTKSNVLNIKMISTGRNPQNYCK